MTGGEIRESQLYHHMSLSLQISTSARRHHRFVAATPLVSTPSGATTASVNLGSDPQRLSTILLSLGSVRVSIQVCV